MRCLYYATMSTSSVSFADSFSSRRSLVKCLFAGAISPRGRMLPRRRGSPDRLRFPYVPCARQSYGSWWQRSARPWRGRPCVRPGTGPQVGVETAQPASMKVLQQAHRHGVQIDLLGGRDDEAADIFIDLFCLCRISAAIMRSSRRPLVQEPMTTWSIGISGICRQRSRAFSGRWGKATVCLTLERSISMTLLVSGVRHRLR